MQLQARELELKETEIQFMQLRLNSSVKKDEAADVEMPVQSSAQFLRQPNTIGNRRSGLMDQSDNELDVDSNFGK